MRRCCFACVLPLSLLAGCPVTDESAVTARIATSTTQGTPPLQVVLSGSESTSENAGALEFEWDLADGTTADTEEVAHTYNEPGYYRVTLEVTDSAGEQDTEAVEIRVRGQTPTAIIQTDQTNGSAPLTVHFSGASSFAPDDDIRDYVWNFGDNSALSVETAPQHTYTTPGTYTARLTVRTGGGAEASTTTTIEVTEATTPSLDFSGTQVATLGLGGSHTLTDWTFETWFKAGSAGGDVFSTPDGSFGLRIVPSSNALVVTLAGATQQALATNLAGSWQHVALVHAAGVSTVLYLNGAVLATGTPSTAMTVSQLNLGLGFVGNLADVRLWAAARSTAQISANYGDRLSSPATEGDLLGYWKLDEYTGQSLANRGTSNTAGVRGYNSAEESADPEWSSDGPELE